MKIIEPRLDTFLLPDTLRYRQIAKHQPQYRTLPALVTDDGRVVSQWLPEPNDLLLLLSGAPITLTVHTFNAPLQPVKLEVGSSDLR